jgi:hypothetical protein
MSRRNEPIVWRAFEGCLTNVLVVVAIVVLVVTGIWELLTGKGDSAQINEPKWTMVAKSDVELRDMTLSVPNNVNGLRTFDAALHNSSSYQVSQVLLQIRLYDCPSKPAANLSNCEVIGETKPSIDTSVPAGQTRRITASLLFENTPRVRGSLTWGYDISQVLAKRESARSKAE